MDLVQSRAAESPSPSPNIIHQNPSKRAYCGACVLGRYEIHPDDGGGGRRVGMKDIVARGADCRACAAISEFLGSQTSMPVELDFLWGYFDTMSPEIHAASARQPYEFFTANIGSTYEERKSFDEPAPFLDHGMISRMRAPSGDTSSTEAFDTLKRWISRCEEEHTLCQPANGKPLPHRLLKIDGIQPLRVQLVEDYPRRESYACLSHRWGPQTKSNSLKTHNLDLYKKKVPEENFYPLMEDAIESAFRLDLHLIWIDCYCIIQDDIKDWEIAAAQMASIYEDAFLTISATDSEGGKSMFSTIGQPYAGVQVTEIGGEAVFLREQLRHPCYFRGGPGDPEGLDAPLLTRGWVFQERRLSNRFVHFMQDEIFWECRESTWCECTSSGLEFKRRRKEAPRTLQNESWEDICLQYSETELSLKKDKLPAFAGIARRYAELHGLTYLAGIWKEHMPAALLWKTFRKGLLDPQPLPKPVEHIAPSWSWLSSPSGLDFRSSYFSRPDSPRYRFLSCNSQSQDADIYAGSDRREITFEAPVLDLKIYKEAENGHVVAKAGNIFLLIRQDFDFDPQEPTKYRSVPDRSSCQLLMINDYSEVDSDIEGILLLKIDGTEGDAMKYERIGYYRYTDCGHYADDLNEFPDYCGGSYPELREKWEYDDYGGLGRVWGFLERAETRQLTIM